MRAVQHEGWSDGEIHPERAEKGLGLHQVVTVASGAYFSSINRDADLGFRACVIHTARTLMGIFALHLHRMVKVEEEQVLSTIKDS